MLRDYQESAVRAVIDWLRYKGEPAIAVLPTGSGKTHVIKALAEHYAGQGLRVLIMAHRKELLSQTGEKIDGDVGYYSASIGEKDISRQITVAGVQSIARLEHSNAFDVILIDECHLVPNGKRGQYWQVIDANPSAKLAGFTATPWRTESGVIAWGDIVYDVNYKTLLERGFLTPIQNKLIDKALPDWKPLDVQMGDFITTQIEDAMCAPELLAAAVKAIHDYCYSRSSVLIFCVSVAHCELIHEKMALHGMTNAEVITGATPSNQRDDMIERFKRGQLKYLINCEVLTVGFDAPCLDAIVCLRPTKSKTLWEQLIGRGTRLHDAKEQCLLIDMAGNLKEHGTLGTPYKGKAKKGEPKEYSGRICPACEEYVEPKTAKECGACGYIFPEPEKREIVHEAKPDMNTYSGGLVETLTVQDVLYAKHISRTSGNTSLRVDYYCEGANYGKVSEWLSPHHPTSDWARGKAHQFFLQRGWDAYGGVHKYEMEDLLWHAERLKKPYAIVVDYSEKYPRIKDYIWEAPSDAPKLPPVFDLDDDIPF